MFEQKKIQKVLMFFLNVHQLVIHHLRSVGLMIIHKKLIIIIYIGLKLIIIHQYYHFRYFQMNIQKYSIIVEVIIPLEQ
jgi:hypothetical protein